MGSPTASSGVVSSDIARRYSGSRTRKFLMNAMRVAAARGSPVNLTQRLKLRLRLRWPRRGRLGERSDGARQRGGVTAFARRGARIRGAPRDCRDPDG